MNIKSLGEGSGKIISCDNRKNILSLDVTTIQNLFKSSGALLLRGFELNEQIFPAFVRQFTSQFLRDDYGNSKAPDPTGGYVQSVTLGNKPIELHCENALSAERPDILWFYCAAPALKDGQTTICDGVSVWEQLSVEVQRLFLTKKAKYTITVPRQIYLNKDKEIILRIGALKFAGTTYRFNDDDSLTIEYVVAAVNKTKYGSQLAFANSITGPYPSYQTTFEDGSSIPLAAMQEIKQLHQKLTENIPWQAGDLVMIDNSRFLHGRRAFDDKQRRIFSMMSLANF
jgi:alpha-ketoglutarate-dependent taurine dioxygenase